jgi:aminodeoxyfutalosine deaminase
MTTDRFPAMQKLKARWIVPVDAPPIENATIEIVDGRIAAISDRPDPQAQDLGNTAILPGPVNAHTHLELSDIAHPLVPASPFTAWLRSVMAHRQARPKAGRGSSDPVHGSRTALAAGIDEISSAGTALVGDIANPHDLALEPARPRQAGHAAARGPRVVRFLELLGLRRERVADQLALARGYLDAAAVDAAAVDAAAVDATAVDATAVDATAGTQEIRGLSPHAPYSVHPELLQTAIDLAVDRSAPVAMHLAETRAELELLARGTGEFVAFLQELGVWEASAFSLGGRPLDALKQLARARRALVIHGNYLDDEESRFVAQHSGMSVVYCPRTHAYFGHEPHPWQALLARGVNVALGTDSRASNPDLNVWNEARFLFARHPNVDPALLVQMATLNGARALGLDHETGSLQPGKRADLALITLDGRTTTNLYELLFAAPMRHP